VNLVETFYVDILPVGFWAIMFGMGMSLTVRDIRHVFVAPKAVAVGLVGQLILLPILAFGLVELFSPAPAIAAGLIILAACPGGVTSNAYVFASRGDLALSVSLTAITSVVTVFSIPFFAYLALDLYYSDAVIPDVPAIEMFLELGQLTIVPIACGMVFRAVKPAFAEALTETLRSLTLVFLVLLVISATIASLDTLVENFASAAFVALSLNFLAMTLGYALGRFFELNAAQRVSITFEVGVQNLSLSFLVILSLLRVEPLAAATLVYAVFMKISALTFVSFARRWLKSEAPARVPVLG